MSDSLITRLSEGGLAYDISPLITEEIAVFPGDRNFKRQVSLSYAQGNNLVLSAISTTVHLGAHTDAPNHYNPDGVGIAERSLDYYLGSCQVVEVQMPQGERIKWSDLGEAAITCRRVLFKTNSFPDPNEWHDNFSSLSPDLIHYLAERGVRLVGIDTPSIDPASSKELESHAAVYANDMAILEGIILEHVPPGVYQMVALPLKLANADASPVRAILIDPPKAF